MGIFKANDIRGIYPDELDPATIYKIGKLLPQILDVKEILVGRDVRISSDAIFDKLAEGINSVGCDVVDIGICDTPAVYFATSFYNYSGSVMITASHNPPEFNGLKISGPNSQPIGPETGLLRLQTEEPVEKEGVVPGKIVKKDIEADYVKHVTSFLKMNNKVKVVVDASNGAACQYMKKMFDNEKIDCQFLLDTPDGSFPNHGPNPVESESHGLIGEQIKASGAALGIIFDGDADRAIFMDENGKFISPDLITALIGKELAGEGDKVYYDLRSSKSVKEYLNKNKITPLGCKSGHANIKKLLKETDGVVAGELSGHYYFKDNFFCDSGFIAALLMLNMVSETDKKMSQIIEDVNPYYFSGEINFKVEKIDYIIENIKNYYPEGEVDTTEGVKIEFADWWFLMRLSGGENILRLVVEAENQESNETFVEQLAEQIMELENQ